MRKIERLNKIKRLLARDGCNCQFCGKFLGLDISLDHIISRANGGTGELHNLQLVHAKCNTTKNTLFDQPEMKRRRSHWGFVD